MGESWYSSAAGRERVVSRAAGSEFLNSFKIRWQAGWERAGGAAGRLVVSRAAGSEFFLTQFK